MLGDFDRFGRRVYACVQMIASVICKSRCSWAVAMLAISIMQPALADKSKLSAEIRAKSHSVGDIASTLVNKGSVRVIVEVELEGVSKSRMEADVRAGTTRAAMKAQIRASIDAVLAKHKLAAKTAGPGEPAITRLTTVPAFAITVSAAELERLAKDPRVKAINYDRPMHRHLDATRPLIGMPSVHAGGGTGVGYSVAVIDDGVQRNHPFIGLSRLIPTREACFLDFNGCPDGTNEQIGTGAGAAAEGQSHGTHVSGIVLGNRASGSPRKGVAPAAKLIPINIFGDDDGTSFSTIQRAFEHVEDLVITSNATLKIATINMSVGGGFASGNCDSDPAMVLLKPVIDNLRVRGVLSVISAGNEYERAAMGFPACLSSMVSVAATSRRGVVSSYTNVSPTTDLFAPGGEFESCVVSSVQTNAYDAFCGTSMAAPHVAGAVAVLKQKAPTASACKIEDALKATGLATADTRSGGVQIKPRIQVDQALARLLSPVAPANDAFSNAVVIPGTTTIATFPGSNIGATLESGEPRHVHSSSHRSVWWQWTPTASGAVKLDTHGSGFDTVLAVYRGGTSAASPGVLVARSDNAPGLTTSEVNFTATAGQTYRVVVGGRTIAQECSIQLNMHRPPANDNFANARTVTVTSMSEVGIGGSNIGATKEVGEPDHNENPAHTTSVWFKFTAPVSGPITVDTEGSPSIEDPVLAIYTGSAVSALTYVASDDDSGTGLMATVTFNMVAGTQYKVMLSSYSSTLTGRYRLWFTPAGAQSLRVNTASSE